MIPLPKREERERDGEKEREGKLLRRLWTGRCSNFKGPIPIFNLLRGQERGGWWWGGSKPTLSRSTTSSSSKAGSLPVPGLVPRILDSRRILFLGPLPPPPTTRDFPSKNLSHDESYGRGSIHAEYNPISSWSNEFHPRARRVEKERGREESLYRSKYRRRFGAAGEAWRVNSIRRRSRVNVFPAIPVKLVAPDV